MKTYKKQAEHGFCRLRLLDVFLMNDNQTQIVRVLFLLNGVLEQKS